MYSDARTHRHSRPYRNAIIFTAILVLMASGIGFATGTGEPDAKTEKALCMSPYTDGLVSASCAATGKKMAGGSFCNFPPVNC